MASGVNNTFRQVGIATGHRRARRDLPGHHLVEAARRRLCGGRLLGAVQQGGELARAAFVSGLNEILLVGAIVAFAGAVLALARDRRHDFVASGPAVAG